jgi:hypothetical protein
MGFMESLNKQGKPRKRAPGAGRPTKHGEATRSIRVPVSISTGQITSLPELQRIIDHWEDECVANPNSIRYHFLRQMLEEMRTLGY